MRRRPRDRRSDAAHGASRTLRDWRSVYARSARIACKFVAASAAARASVCFYAFVGEQQLIGRQRLVEGFRAEKSDITLQALCDQPLAGRGVKAERLLAYVEQFLVPILKPGEVVVLNNLGSHKGKLARHDRVEQCPLSAHEIRRG